MRKTNLLLCLVLVLACAQLFATGTRQTATTSGDLRQVYTLYWDTNTRDVDWYGAPIPTRIREKTGVTVEYRGVLGNEAEQLNIALASGNLPDIISAALWGGQHAATILLQRAAQQGQIVPIEQYISKY
jgi:ABC-type glycerol-3-phosphate transport system substrate-binding protein